MTVGYETVLILTIVMYALYAGASANSYFMIHKMMLLHLKEDLLLMQGVLNSKSKYKSAN
jgi:hypothetical protein